jgi:hypothetical protein
MGFTSFSGKDKVLAQTRTACGCDETYQQVAFSPLFRPTNAMQPNNVQTSDSRSGRSN